MIDRSGRQKAGFLDDLAALVQDPAIRALARHRAGSRELAEDALQDTFYYAARKSPEEIRDLLSFFCKSLTRTIDRELARSAARPTEDIAAIADSRPGLSPPGTAAADSIAGEVHLRALTEAAFNRLERERQRGELMAMIPARSEDPRRYRATILEAAEKILRLLCEGPVPAADWNAVLTSEYPQWFDESGLAYDGQYRRLSRARADVRMLLRAVLPLQGDEPHPGPGATLTRTRPAPHRVIHLPDGRVRTADDAVLTALFLKAEQAMLPEERPYNLEQELQMFTRWLDRQA
jgi:DNA-directed RNA polymerase specialized sigma24 family protein